MAELWIIFTIVLVVILVCSFMMGVLQNVGTVDAFFVYNAESDWAIDTFIDEMEYHLKRLKELKNNKYGK